MRKHTPKQQPHLVVTGKMNQEQAGQVGLKLANAALIRAIAGAFTGLAALAVSLYFWFR